MTTHRRSSHPSKLSSSRRVLVVDDDALARETMVELLRRAGHEVISLPSAIGATKAIVAASVEVVVLDLVMPSAQGDKLATLLGKNPRLKHIGVVLVTGGSTTELVGVASKLGASTILQKSRLTSDLEPAVRRAGR